MDVLSVMGGEPGGDSVKPGEELVILLYKQLTPTKRWGGGGGI